MKAFIISCVTVVTVIFAVFTNSLYITKRTDGFIEKLEALPADTSHSEEYGKIYDEFMGITWYLTLTVNHTDISEIELCFAELLGAISAGDTESVIITKSRLLQSFLHFRRLSEININSIL